MSGSLMISTVVTKTVYEGQGSYAVDLTIMSTGTIQTSSFDGIDGGSGIPDVSITSDGSVSPATWASMVRCSLALC